MSDGDDLPTPLHEEEIRDPDSTAWIPVAGPLRWERRTTVESSEWLDEDDNKTEGIVVRDSVNDREKIASDLYVPNIKNFR